MAGVLNEIGGPYGAGSLLPEPVPPVIQANQAGMLVRWGNQVTPRDPRRRFEGTDAALKRLNQLLVEARAKDPPDTALITRLRYDRVVALRQREYWGEAAAEVQKLREDGEVIPPYVREAEADALLALRHPTEARMGYEEVLQVDPQLREAHIGRFFAFVEEENFDEAFAEIDTLAAGEPPGKKLPNQSSKQANWD